MANVTSDSSIEELVLVPGGEFLMGSDSEGDHSPVHKVYIDSFYIDRCVVTNAQYLKFCEATGHRLPDFWGMEGFRCGPDYPNHPVITVSWYDATEYAKWCGRRLPTEAEWEYAARGGLVGMDYPNGDTLYPSDGNYNQSGKGGPVAYIMVDSMRYEMGVELRDQLKDADVLKLEAAVAAIPTITTLGMAALLPGASASFSVTEDGAKLTAIEGEPPDMAQLPLGCSFRPRCVYGEDRCSREFPPLEPVGEKHYAACWVKMRG